MKRTTSIRSAGGANIKGNPKMSAAFVRNDLGILKSRLDIVMLQEFEWTWYWRIAGILLDKNWNSFPSFAVGTAKPVNGAQGILWKSKLVKRVASKEMPAFNFSLAHAGVMDDRWIRAVLLEDIATKLRCWYISTHFVVGGDGKGDSARRKQFLSQNINALDEMLAYCSRTGDAMAFEIDGNLHPDSWAMPAFMAMIKKYGGRVVGPHGVEWMVVFDGPSTKIVVDRSYELEPKKTGLKTDHEVRCMDHHLESVA